MDLSKDTRKNKRNILRTVTDPKNSMVRSRKRSWLGAYNKDHNSDGNSALCSCKREINNSGVAPIIEATE